MKKSILCYIKGVEESKSGIRDDSEENWDIIIKEIHNKSESLVVQFFSLNYYCFIEGPYSISYACFVYSIYHLIGTF